MQLLLGDSKVFEGAFAMSIETEYVALREEILKRVEIRYALVSLTITIAGSMLSFSLQMIQLVDHFFCDFELRNGFLGFAFLL